MEWGDGFLCELILLGCNSLAPSSSLDESEQGPTYGLMIFFPIYLDRSSLPVYLTIHWLASWLKASSICNKRIALPVMP